MVAAKFRVKYIFEGHSYIEEGMTPTGSNYLDGGYVASIHNKYGSMKRKSFPNMTFYQFLKWTIVYQQQFIRPFWYIDYSKEEARKELIEKTGWIYYGGHHLENRASSFAHLSWLPKKFNIDYRNMTLSAKVRNGKLSRLTAPEIRSFPPAIEWHLNRPTIGISLLNLGWVASCVPTGKRSESGKNLFWSMGKNPSNV